MQALADTRPKLPVLAASILVSVATGLACGFLPAWQAYRKDARAVTNRRARAYRGRRRCDHATGAGERRAGIEHRPACLGRIAVA